MKNEIVNYVFINIVDFECLDVVKIMNVLVEFEYDFVDYSSNISELMILLLDILVENLVYGVIIEGYVLL